MSPYTPVFLDGWQPALCDDEGQPLEDPVESEQRYEALVESQAAQVTHWISIHKHSYTHSHTHTISFTF